MIDSFRDEYFFLSNFYETSVSYEGLTYQNTEAAFQAQKSLDPAVRAEFTGLSAASAKHKGRKVNLRKDWEQVKDQLMYEICLAKFTQHADLAALLLQTGDEELVEGNNWNDRYWGVSRGSGRNQLGKTLMRIREELRNCTDLQ